MLTSVLDFSLQVEDIIEHIASKYNMFTLTINLLTIVYPKHRPHNIIKNANAKIIVSTLTPNVMRLR
jgi:hypothetical protein